MFFKQYGQEKSFFRSRDAWILISLCLFCKCYSLVSPGVLQLDLVFPQQDAVYDAMEVLPIAMILHNVNFAWPAVPRLSWTLSRLIGNGTKDDEGIQGSDLIDEGSYPEKQEDHDEFESERGYWDETGPNNIVVVNTAKPKYRSGESGKKKRSILTLRKKQEKDVEAEKYRLDFRLELEGTQIPACKKLSRQSDPLPQGPQQILSNPRSSDARQSIDSALESSVTFVVKPSIASSRKSKPTIAKSPSAVATLRLGDCPSPIGAIRIANEAEEYDCLALENPTPTYQHCTVRIDDYVRDRVAQAVMSAIAAPIHSTTSKLAATRTTESKLGAEKQKQTFQSGAAFMVALTGTFFGMVGLMLSMWTIYVGPEILMEIA